MSNEYISTLTYTAESNLQHHYGLFSSQEVFINYKILFAQESIPPLFILPTSFLAIEYTDTKLVDGLSKSKKTKSRKGVAKTPFDDSITEENDDTLLLEADPVLTGFANSYRSLQFSLRFFNYITSPINHIKLLIADNQYSQEALKFYKSNPLNIKQLEYLIAREEIKYKNQLKQITFIFKSRLPNGTEKQTRLNLNQKQIDEVIIKVKEDVDKNHLNPYFQQSRNLIIQNAGFTEREYTEEELVTFPEIKAMMDTLVYAEGTGAGYGTIVKGLVKKSPNYPELIGKRDVVITDFSKHPEIYVDFGSDWSTAAGRYQILYNTWKGYGGEKMDFSPRSQDIILIRIMKYRKMIEPLLEGDIRGAIHLGAPEWMSLPMLNGKSYKNQPVKNINDLLRVYNEALAKYKN